MGLRDWLDIEWELFVSAASLLNHPSWDLAYIDRNFLLAYPFPDCSVYTYASPLTVQVRARLTMTLALYMTQNLDVKDTSPQLLLEPLGKKPGFLTWWSGAGAAGGHLGCHTGRAHPRRKPRRGEQIQEEQSQIPGYIVDWIFGPSHAGHIFRFESKRTFSAEAVWTGVLPPEVSKKSPAEHST